MNRLLTALLVGLLLFGLNEGSGNESWNRVGSQLDANTCWHNAARGCWCCSTDEDKESCNSWCIEQQHLRVGLCGWDDKNNRQCCICLN